MPGPALVKPPLPASTALTVAPLVTAIVGVPELTARVSGSPVPGLSVQLFSGAALSPKVRFPIVREPSSVTVVLAVMSSVLKSAVKPVPSAITLLFQLPAVAQLPPARLFQVPLAACPLTPASARIRARPQSQFFVRVIMFIFSLWWLGRDVFI